MAEVKKEKNLIKGFALTGMEAKSYEDKRFIILEEPQYVEITDPRTNKKSESLLFKIQFNSYVLDYYPNKTSMAVILACRGRDLAKWTGYIGEFYVENQKVGGKPMDCIYIKIPKDGESQ